MDIERLILLFAVLVFATVKHEIKAEDKTTTPLETKTQRPERRQGSSLRDLHRIRNKTAERVTKLEQDSRGIDRRRPGTDSKSPEQIIRPEVVTKIQTDGRGPDSHSTSLDRNEEGLINRGRGAQGERSQDRDGRGSERPRDRKRGKDNLNIIREKLKPRSKPRDHDTMFSDNDETVVVVNEVKPGNYTPTLSDKIEILRSQHHGVPNYEVIGDDSYGLHVIGVYCNFEKARWKNSTVSDMCAWEWNRTISSFGNGFQVLSPLEMSKMNRTRNYMVKGPEVDADGNKEGHFLYLPVDPTMETMVIKSPLFPGLWEFCKFEVMFHQSSMQNASIRIVAESPYTNLSWILQEVTGNNIEQWTPLRFTIGKVHQDVHIIIEIVRPATVDMSRPLPHIAADNLRMLDCFPEPPVYGGECGPGQIKCSILHQESCIKLQQVCDLVKDCDGSVDEMQNCDKMPPGSYCDFEDGDCGFADVTGNILKWSRHSGPTPTAKTGPNYDHTCGPPDARAPPPVSVPLSPARKNYTNLQCVGWYFFVNMNVTGPDNKKPDFASTAVMRSAVFNPPPRLHGDINSKYYNSCMIRFYYNQNGRNYGSLSVFAVQMTMRGNISTSLWFSTKDKGEHWHRAAIFLPNITTRYFVEIRTRMGMRIYSDSAIDDFSLAPECFGLNMDPEELGDYNYYDPVYEDQLLAPNKAFKDKTVYKFTPCGAVGSYGPNQTMCETAYNGTAVSVSVLNDTTFKGIQIWEVPAEGYYTIMASGARGGLGSSWSGLSQGAHARGLFELHKGERLYMLVGQAGHNACKKDNIILSAGRDISQSALSSQHDSSCQKKPTNTSLLYTSKTHEVKNTIIQDGGGGGGGAIYVFILDKDGRPVPLVVAGGGGGLSMGMFHDDGSQNGRPPGDRPAQSGYMYGSQGLVAGAGGGWAPRSGPDTPGFGLVRGGALLEGAAGGAACSGVAHGGFGGGGGGCTKGGGGGGYIGGDSPAGEHGGGGYSYISEQRSVAGFTRFSLAHSTTGEVLVVPAVHDCGCDYRCVALDEHMSDVKCYCPAAWQTDEQDPTKCIMDSDWTRVQWTLIVVLSVIVMLCAIGLVCGCLYLYNTYQRKKEDEIRRKHLAEQEVQLRRLRHTPEGSHALTNFNPHYGCEGMLPQGVDVRGLPQVTRESLKLVKALGQGAFGEVYQGLYKHRTSDAQEMPVAVKTLPEMSTGQSETEFLMEAAIMAKFNHPNVVHLIGVCFDRHPRFIVLELLAGGDLKVFLRDSRPKPERTTTLTMKDLLLCALDVAKGCRYLEAKRFIHRDVAARNCLLTSRGPGRVVKIADFGMARDIYRADYYKKGGKALLPIKWMPPEAFLDGVFTVKTDIWSFGVLLWEVFALGVMPYTGCTNREVMELVVEGGRLQKPVCCPDEIYKLMNDAWNPHADERPTFIQIHDRLQLFLQDPEILSIPLPVVMSVKTHEMSQERVQPNCDYLVPLVPARDVASSSSTDPLLPHSKPAAATRSLELDSEYPHLLRASQEYGNIPGSAWSRRRGSREDGNTGSALVATRSNKFQPSKSTERLLSGGTPGSPASTDSIVSDPDAEWETSFIQSPCEHAAPPVEKLISIDTPQQTPTSTEPPETLNGTNAPARRKSLTAGNGAPMASPEPIRINAWANEIDNTAKNKPLCLDASKLEENLNALKKNIGSVMIGQLNVYTKDLNVVTAVADAKVKPLDTKETAIDDNATPKVEAKLKSSSSAASLLNGPMTEVPYADSDHDASSDQSSLGNHVAARTKYSEVIIEGRKVRKQNSNGSCVSSDVEINC